MIEHELADLIVGSSPVMRRLRETIASVGPTRLPVLILGPTGAGKELVAHGLHLASGRSGAFEPCNVSTLSPALFESVVFGHVRGAFTGAVHTSCGHLVKANGGTMFFDEIGALALETQPKLLRALDGYGFRPVGAARDCASDFRLVSATNEDLPAMVNTGRFRLDLWHRLAGVTLRVPSLSARLEDLPELTEHLLASRSAGNAKRRQVTGDALGALHRHTWRGNVRELAITLERACSFSHGGAIDAAHIEAAIDHFDGIARTHALRKVGHQRLLAALRETGGDTLRAAHLLGISRPTVYRQLQSLGMTARGWRDTIKTDCAWGESSSVQDLDDLERPLDHLT